jgi:hypothetical protein
MWAIIPLLNQWKLYRAKRLLTQTEIGRFLLRAAGKIFYKSLPPPQMLLLAQSYGFSNPRAVFHYRNGKKQIFYRQDLKPLELAVVLAHELTHASDYRFLNRLEPATQESEATAVLFQNEFAHQVMKTQPTYDTRKRNT